MPTRNLGGRSPVAVRSIPLATFTFPGTVTRRMAEPRGRVNLYVTKSSDGGQIWTQTLLDVSGAPPDCSAFSCGWAFLGPGIAMTSDATRQRLVHAEAEITARWSAGRHPRLDGPDARLSTATVGPPRKNKSSTSQISCACRHGHATDFGTATPTSLKQQVPPRWPQRWRSGCTFRADNISNRTATWRAFALPGNRATR